MVVIVVGKTSGGDPLKAGVKSPRFGFELLLSPTDWLSVFSVGSNPVKAGGAIQADSYDSMPSSARGTQISKRVADEATSDSSPRPMAYQCGLVYVHNYRENEA